MTVASIGNGAKELLDEVATGKISGEEDIFSHTDLSDFQANVDGAKKAFEVLKPLDRRRRTGRCSRRSSPTCRPRSTSTSRATALFLYDTADRGPAPELPAWSSPVRAPPELTAAATDDRFDDWPTPSPGRTGAGPIAAARSVPRRAGRGRCRRQRHRRDRVRLAAARRPGRRRRALRRPAPGRHSHRRQANCTSLLLRGRNGPRRRVSLLKDWTRRRAR